MGKLSKRKKKQYRMYYEKNDCCSYIGDLDSEYGYGEELYGRMGYYVGEFFHMRKHGKGKEVHYGDCYEGTFDNDEWTGNGYSQLYNCAGEIYYKGEVKNHIPHGYGIEYDLNGNIFYEGKFVNGIPIKLNGIAKKFDDNGQLYFIGQYRKGLKHGYCVEVGGGNEYLYYKKGKLIKFVLYEDVKHIFGHELKMWLNHELNIWWN